MLKIGTYLQNRYEILDLIGSGGMSDVYKAKCHKLNRLVAIKVLKDEFSSDETFLKKFRMEAQAAALLSHPNIINIYELVDEGDLHYIVMELVEGVTLKEYIKKRGVLEIKEAVGIAIQMCQGIAVAHEHGIIHRDIKPQNMIIAKDGTVKVADFGIARATTSETMTMTAMGSVHYISPEQVRGGFCDARSDIYSIGITMFEMVTGRVPFDGDNTVTIALAHLEEPIMRPSIYNPEVPTSLENIILKCTEKKPDRRYDSVNEIIADLRHVLVHPDDDIVALPEDDNLLDNTVIIGSKEIETIRREQQNLHSIYGEGETGQSLNTDMARNTAQRSRNNNSNSSINNNNNNNNGNNNNKNKNSSNDDEDISPSLEKIMSLAGIVVAVLIIIVLIIVFFRLGGLFGSSSSDKNGTTIQAGLTISSDDQDISETLNDTQVYMPDVIGLPEELAESKLKDSTLVMYVSDYVESDEVQEGYVVSQNPAEGEVVSKYSTVDVVISSGSDLISLNDLEIIGMNGDSAVALLKQNNITSEQEYEYSDDVPEGYVVRFVSSDPDYSEKARPGDEVTLYVSLGSAADYRTVPNIKGMTESAASEALTAVQLIPGTVTSSYSDTVSAGIIISQEIEAETTVKAGSEIPYVVSLGPSTPLVTHYVASINESYQASTLIGPGASDGTIELLVRLRQDVNGRSVYTTLIPVTQYSGDEVLNLNFQVEGADGVTTGEIEIVNMTTGLVVQTYPLTFTEVTE